MYPEDLSHWSERQIDDFILLMNLEAAEQDRKHGNGSGGSSAVGGGSTQSAADTEAVFQKMREQQKQREASAGGL